MLAAIGITRGEEDCRRWDLLLAGRFRIADVVVRCLAAFGSSMLIGVAVAARLLVVRTDGRSGALCSRNHLCCFDVRDGSFACRTSHAERSSATGSRFAALRIGLTLRMIADGSHQLAWLAWATPFGLTARSAPYAEDRIAPLIVFGTFPIVLAVRPPRRAPPHLADG